MREAYTSGRPLDRGESPLGKREGRGADSGEEVERSVRKGREGEL